jgi:hypothetical protein
MGKGENNEENWTDRQTNINTTELKKILIIYLSLKNVGSEGGL